MRTLRAADLVPELLPKAKLGLVEAGVAADETDLLLAVISGRVTSGQTGAARQRAALPIVKPLYGRERALVTMLEQYLENSDTGQPVHTWPPWVPAS